MARVAGGPVSTGLRHEPVLRSGTISSRNFEKNELFLNLFPGYLNSLTVSNLISNHPYSHVKVYTRDPTSRSVIHAHTASPLACLTSPFHPY
jgi:hypothetical protein